MDAVKAVHTASFSMWKFDKCMYKPQHDGCQCGVWSALAFEATLAWMQDVNAATSLPSFNITPSLTWGIPDVSSRCSSRSNSADINKLDEYILQRRADFTKKIIIVDTCGNLDAPPEGITVPAPTRAANK